MNRRIIGFIIGLFVGLLFTILLLALGYAIESNEKFIPVLVGMIGAFSGLVGVWVTNYFNNKNHKNRLDFDSLQKERDRIYTLRKDIYLVANDEIIRMSNTIGGLTNPIGKLNKAEESFSNFLIAINRLQVISNIDTSIKAGLLIKFFTEFYLDVYLDATNIININNEIELNQSFIKKYTEDIDRVLDLMKVNYEADDINHLKQKKLEISFETLMENRNKYYTEIEGLREKSHSLAKELLNKIIEKMPEIQAENKEFMVLLRKDMLGDNDSEAFAQSLIDPNNSGQKLIKELAKRLE